MKRKQSKKTITTIFVREPPKVDDIYDQVVQVRGMPSHVQWATMRFDDLVNNTSPNLHLLFVAAYLKWVLFKLVLIFKQTYQY